MTSDNLWLCPYQIIYENLKESTSFCQNKLEQNKTRTSQACSRNKAKLDTGTCTYA